jgi:hypothetical protein
VRDLELRLYPPMKKMTESTDNRNPLKPGWHIAFVSNWPFLSSYYYLFLLQSLSIRALALQALLKALV